MTLRPLEDSRAMTSTEEYLARLGGLKAKGAELRRYL